jgi:outer membrane protein assembly factor BamB
VGPGERGTVMRGPARVMLVALCSTLFLSGCAFWPQFRFGPERQGWNPLETTLTPANVGTLTEKWKSQGANVRSSPTVLGNTVYIGAANKLAIVNATSGVVTGGVAPTGSVGSSAAVFNGVVYFGSDDGKVYAANAASGAVLWTTITGGAVRSSPAVVNGVVYVGSQDGKAYALNATTGAIVWTATIGTPIGDSTPAVSNGVVYILGSALVALDATTGATLWTFPVSDIASESSPVVADGRVYFGTGTPTATGTLWALNAATGAFVWNAPVTGRITSAPAVANGVVYVSSGFMGIKTIAEVNGFDAATGNKEFFFSPDFEMIESSPSVANGVVYVGTTVGRIYALNATTSAVLFSFATGAGIVSSPAVTDGVVYVNNGSLYAFGLP